MKQYQWTAEQIRKARKKKGLTQAQLAEGLGSRQQTISEWELDMYLPKNAYNKLLTLFFGVQDDAEDESEDVSKSEETTQHANV